jgi:hypothetical protein
MKKSFLTLFFLILITPLCFGGEKKVNSTVTTRSFSANDVSFDQAHVCDSQSFNCSIPEKLITGFPVLNIQFFVPVTRAYTKYYLVADTAGTLVRTEVFTNFESAGVVAYTLDEPSLGVGDYIFTAIVIDNFGNGAISDPYRFSVR